LSTNYLLGSFDANNKTKTNTRLIGYSIRNNGIFLGVKIAMSIAQSTFKTQFGLNFSNEIIVDLFAGGGGASTGIEIGTGRNVAIAINHDEDAISMHMVNHPHTKHYISDVYDVDPIEACGGFPVGALHASPDCTDHSQAKGGQPRKKKIRSLAGLFISGPEKLSRDL